MKIAICSSLDFAEGVMETAEKLRVLGHEVILPQTIEKIASGEVTFDQIMEEKDTGEILNRIIKHDLFKYYYEQIKKSDAVLVTNFDKKGIKGYIGGAVFLEMGYAHILNKKIFLLKEIPKMGYTDEIKGLQPIMIDGNLSKIK